MTELALIELKALGVEFRYNGIEAEVNWRNAEQIGEWLLALIDEHAEAGRLLGKAIWHEGLNNEQHDQAVALLGRMGI